MVENSDQKIDAFLNECSRFQMTAPHLTSTVGETQVKVNALGRERSIQGDDFKVTL